MLDLGTRRARDDGLAADVAQAAAAQPLSTGVSAVDYAAASSASSSATEPTGALQLKLSQT